MAKDKPDHNDAELVLRLYELRRETVMRQSRDAILRDFWPSNFEEFMAALKPDSPLNAPFRQVSSYWEMAYGFVAHGVLNADMLLETGAEGLFMFAKVEPFLAQFRKEGSPTAFKNAEFVATQTDIGRQRYEMIKGRVAKMREAFAGKK
jgi:hypothetical protein